MSRKILSYYFASFFILCGLIIGILGSYQCIALKHYAGYVQLGTPMAIELKTAYPNDVVECDTSILYNISDTKLLDLPYTTDKGFIWLAIPIGILYILLGILAITRKDLIFRSS